MSEGAIAKRYARALFEIAKEKNAFDAFVGDLNLLNDAIQGSPELRRFLNHPGFGIETKKEKISNIFAGNVSGEVLSLTLLLLERGRQTIFPDLVKEFVALANDARNVVDATVYTAYPMNNGELDGISKQFGEKIGKTINMRNDVDASIIGGLVIRIGDRLYDASVKGKLNRFKQSLAHS